MSNFIKSLVFNIVETIVIYMIGLIFKISFNYIITLMLTFFLCRMLCGQPKHYKSAYKCFLWSTLTFTSVYALTDLHIVVVILLTIFTGFISTGKANIRDMFMWSGKDSKYSALLDLISLSPNNSIIADHEEYWRKNYPIKYEIFKLYFRERNTYEEIMEIKDLPDSKLIQRECKSIYQILERPLDLPPIN